MNETEVRSSDDLRERTSQALTRASGTVLADAVAMFPLVAADHLDPASARQVADLLLRLLAQAVRDGHVDGRGPLVTELHRVSRSRAITTARLFGFAALIERAGMDDLSVHETLGALGDHWPTVVQLMRSASFDVLAALAERAAQEPTEAALLDPVTKLHARPVFDTVLGKELDRAGRTGQSISLALFDVDRLGNINEALGPGVGDKILERLGGLLHGYFRRHDWVARYEDDTFAVLLTGTDGKRAKDLAERVRTAVADRLSFPDHRTGDIVPVRVSVAVVTREVAAGEFVDPERFIADCKALLKSQTHEPRATTGRRTSR